jgi:hypothetical protein
MSTKADIALQVAVAKGYKILPDGTPIGPTGRTLKGYLKGRSRPKETAHLHKEILYRHISVVVEKTTYPVPVHRLHGYQKFGDRVFDKTLVVCHLDEDSLNNTEANLELGTHGDNSMQRKPEARRALSLKGARAQRRWTLEQVRELRRRRRAGETGAALAREEGVSQGQMCDMLNRRTYKTA